jgi:hypothetical protein
MTKKIASTLADETGKWQALPWNVVASNCRWFFALAKLCTICIGLTLLAA